MKIHEYRAKELLRGFGVGVPRGFLATTPFEAEAGAREREAREHDLACIALDGDIGCLVSGAGRAMATMDVIRAAGGRPA